MLLNYPSFFNLFRRRQFTSSALITVAEKSNVNCYYLLSLFTIKLKFILNWSTASQTPDTRVPCDRAKEKQIRDKTIPT